MGKPLHVFCCYAREDQLFLLKLKKYLEPLQREGLIVVQADIDISGGEEWEQKIRLYLDTAQIILLLISPDFMASDYCYGKEMMRAMERHEHGEARIIPIILRPTPYWPRTPLVKLQALPTNAKPVTSPDWHTLDEAFSDLTEGIQKVVVDLITPPQADQETVLLPAVTPTPVDHLLPPTAQQGRSSLARLWRGRPNKGRWVSLSLLIVVILTLSPFIVSRVPILFKQVQNSPATQASVPTTRLQYFITHSVEAGSSTTGMRIHGQGFGVNEQVAITFDLVQVDTAFTDTEGEFFISITLPYTVLPGHYYIVHATGQTSGLTAQASFLMQQADWNEFRFDASHTGYNPYENILNTSNVSGLTLDWIYSTKDNVWTAPAVVDGIVYFGSDDRKFYALDAATGKSKWMFTAGNIIATNPAVVDGIVYFGSDDHKLYALDAATGKSKWIGTFAAGAFQNSSPVVVNGIVYIGSLDDNLYAVDAATGRLKWHYTTRNAIESSPAVTNGVVYVGSHDHQLYALNAATGSLKWHYTTENMVNSSPAIVKGIVYVGSDDGYVYALDATTGGLKWRYLTGTKVNVNSSPAIANGVLYIGTDAQTMDALDVTTGMLKWRYTIKGNIDSSPAVANGLVYFGSLDGNFYVLDAATGVLKWNYNAGDWIDSSPAVVNGVVYFGSLTGVKGTKLSSSAK